MAYGDPALQGPSAGGSRPGLGPSGGGGGGGGGVDPTWAIAAGIFAELTSAYANFTASRIAKEQTKAQASAFGHRARMLELDRRSAELRAQSILEQGNAEIGQLGLEAAQRRAAIAAGTAARGVEAGVGSAAEVQASERLIQAIDAYHINLDTVRAAEAERTRAVGIANEARFSRASARNLRRSAKTAYPESHLIAGLGSAAIRGGSLL